MSSKKLIKRRNFLKTSGTVAGLSVLPWMSPSLAIGADRTITLALPNNPANFDPAHQANHDTMACSQVVFENLIELDTDGNIQPMLAKSWSMSDDGMTYTFDLRDDVFFHNGQKMTAEDVKYSYDTVRDKKYKLRRRSLWTPIKEVVIESPTRVRFDMEFPYNDLPKLMTKYMGIWPKGSREPGQPGDAAGKNLIKKGPVGLGTGPGIFVKFVSNDYVEFKRNPNYWRKDVPKWDKLVFRIVPEDAVRVAYLLTNQAQVITAPPPREFVRLKDFENINGATKPSYGFMMLTMNLNAAPMDDMNFRFAVSRAINREEIAKLFGGIFTPHAVFTFAGNAPGRPFNMEAEKALNYNLESAKEYLSKSKYPNGTDFELVIPAVPYIVNVSEAALLLQGQLAKIGINVQIQTLQMRSYFKKAFGKDKTNNMHVFMNPPSTTYGLAGQFGSGRKIQLAKNFENLYPETSKEFDAVCKQAWAAKSEADKVPYVEKMQGLIARECTGIAIGNVSAANLWRSDVKGFDVNTCVTMRTRDLSLG